MTGAALLVVGLGVLGATGWLTAVVLGVPGLVGRLLGMFTVAFAWTVVLSLTLSAPGWLSRWPFVVGLVGGLGVALGAWRAAGKAPLRAGGARSSVSTLVRDPVLGALACVVGLELLYVLAFTLVIPQSDWDALVYHLPRAAAWIQQGGIGWIGGVADPRVNGFPPHAEIAVADTMLLAASDRYTGLVQLLSLTATVAAVHGIGRRLGLGLRGAAFGALVFATFTVVALQAGTALNDLVVAAPVAAATYLALGRTRGEVVVSALAVAVAFGVKLTAFLTVPLAALVVLIAAPRARRLPIAAAWVIGAIAGSYWYVVARVHTGSFDGGVADFQHQTPDRSPLPTLARTESFVLSFFDAPGITGADRWLFPLAGLGLVATGAWVARSGRRGRDLVGAGIVVAVAPLAVYILHRALSEGFARSMGALGGADDATRLDRSITSVADTMSSWYGVAFLLLALATPVLAVRAVREGALARAALPAALAPLVFALVLAIAVIDDGLRGRFFMLPVALAAAVFGVALRVRWLAWSTVCLASLTALLAFVHFDDRPAGIRLLAGRTQPSLWSVPRWQALGAHHRVGRDDPRAFRALQELVPTDTVLAYAVGADEYLYPAFDAQLRRRVVFVPPGARVPAGAEWAMVGPGGAARGCTGAWRHVSEPAPGWRLSRRVATDGGCASTVRL